MTVRAPLKHLASTMLAVVCLLAGCALTNNADSSSQNGGGAGGNRAALSLAAFKEVVHPVMTANCGGCHGSTQAPTFALASAESAWSVVEANGLVSSLDAASSRVVIKGGTAHGGCGTCNATTSGQLRDAIAEWNRRMEEGGSGTPPPPPPGANRIVLASVNVDVPVGSTTPVPVTFSLDQAGIAGGSIRLRITRFGNDFILDRIQVVAANSPIQIEDVLPIANGNLLQSSAAWRGVKTIVGTQRSVTVTTDAVLLGVSSITTLGLSLLKLNTSTARTCRTAAQFAATVAPVIASRCIGCHGNGGSGAGAMNLSANACESFLERAVPGAFSKAATVGMPRFSFFGHPTTTLTDTEVGRFTTWYQGENP